MFPYTENTTNPNPIFKISIYCTRQTNNAKMYSNVWFVVNKTFFIFIYKKAQFIFCILCNSCKFVYICFWGDDNTFSFVVYFLCSLIWCEEHLYEPPYEHPFYKHTYEHTLTNTPLRTHLYEHLHSHTGSRVARASPGVRKGVFVKRFSYTCLFKGLRKGVRQSRVPATTLPTPATNSHL